MSLDELLDRVAQTLYEAIPDPVYAWVHLPDDIKVIYRAQAKALISMFAEVWDEGVEYSKERILEDMKYCREIVGPEMVMASDTEPIMKAIDAAPSRLNYRQYVAHLHWVALSSMYDWLTVRPEMNIDGEIYEADEDFNPYREKP